MKKQADYIKRIEIKRLWGRKDISWELRPDVNILSGVNGIGKSTILNRSVNSLSASCPLTILMSYKGYTSNKFIILLFLKS